MTEGFFYIHVGIVPVRSSCSDRSDVQRPVDGGRPMINHRPLVAPFVASCRCNRFDSIPSIATRLGLINSLNAVDKKCYSVKHTIQYTRVNTA